MEFKKGDEVISSIGEFMVVAPEPDINGVIIVRNCEYGYVATTEESLTLKPKAQNWFGIEIDAFDTELPNFDHRYYFYAVDADCYTWDYFNEDTVHDQSMAAGYWLDEEKAKRSAPKMYKRMCEMAKGEQYGR